MKRYAIIDDEGIIEETEGGKEILKLWRTLEGGFTLMELLGLETQGELKLIEIKG